MEYKSNKFVVIKSFVIMLVGTAMVGLFVYMFTKNETYGMIVIGLAILLSVLMSVSEWKFRLELDDNTIRVYSGQKLKQELDITNASFYSRTKQGGNNIGVDCKLEVTTPEMTYTIDCTPLGGRQYQLLLDALGFDENKPQVPETMKKGEE